MSAPDLVLCPECQGAGEVPDRNTRLHHPHPHDPDQVMARCRCCAGEGTVTPPEARRRAARLGWTQQEIRDWIAKGTSR